MGRRPEKRPRISTGDGSGGRGKATVASSSAIKRLGCTQRANKYSVEMRPPGFRYKMYLGTYATKEEFMVARDYGAHLRVVAPGETVADAGGFGDDDKLYHFEQSPAIFDTMSQTSIRRGEIAPLYRQMVVNQTWGEENPPHHEFCKAARKDIKVAIRMFREQHPDLLSASSPAETELESDPNRDCPPSSSNTGATAGVDADSSVSGGWSDMPVEVAVSVNGIPLRPLSEMCVLSNNEETVIAILRDRIAKAIHEVLSDYSFEKILERMEPCSVDPLSIPALE